jgi:hypothetical protein
MRTVIDSAASFAGAGYDPQFDHSRLALQVERVRVFMLRVEWQTLREIKTALEAAHAPCVFPESSISAQLRNLKKPPYSYRLEKRRRAGVRGPGAGIWEYRLRPPAQIDLAFSVQRARAPQATRVGAGGEPDDERGREEFLREARRIASSRESK